MTPTGQLKEDLDHKNNTRVAQLTLGQLKINFCYLPFLSLTFWQDTLKWCHQISACLRNKNQPFLINLWAGETGGKRRGGFDTGADRHRMTRRMTETSDPRLSPVASHPLPLGVAVGMATGTLHQTHAAFWNLPARCCASVSGTLKTEMSSQLLVVPPSPPDIQIKNIAKLCEKISFLLTNSTRHASTLSFPNSPASLGVCIGSSALCVYPPHSEIQSGHQLSVKCEGTFSCVMLPLLVFPLPL